MLRAKLYDTEESDERSGADRTEEVLRAATEAYGSPRDEVEL